MAQWYSYVRSQDNATASISIDIGIDAERDLPSRPLAFLLVRRIDDGAKPQPIHELEELLRQRLEVAGFLLVATLTMSGSRTLVVYGDDDERLREIMSTVDEPFAIQTSDDRAWQLYRTLLPTNEEITNS
ncbi:MAG: DUF695 domain-containing protein [Candidatus Eremiobacteraeota bacterium]|nr:DUF695 domain-containing protein [Candidatus Eremiobacteraeota bacterium]